MELHETDYIMYYNMHRIRFTCDLFHAFYFAELSRDDGKESLRSRERLSDLLGNEESRGIPTYLLKGAFKARMIALYHLGTKAKCAEWFKPELRPMVNNRHPYIAVAAVEPMEFEMIAGYPDLAFSPDSFRSRLKETEMLWSIMPDVEASLV